MASLTFNPRRRTTKRFCKVCFDSKKTEKEYTSHFVKDQLGPRGKVVCPTLLATICRYCRCSGHFKSHCPKLVQRKRENHLPRKPQTTTDSEGWTTKSYEATKNRQPRRVAQPSNKFVTHVNIFDALGEAPSQPANPIRIEKAVPTPAKKAPALQGAWKVHFQIEKPVVQEPVVQEPVVQEPAVQEPAVQEPSDDLNTRKRANRIQQLEAELAEAKADLEEEMNTKTSWADAGDVDDAELRVECLEEKLERLKNKN